MIQDFVKPQAGDRLVDLGCGTGASLRQLPADIAYVGLDLNPEYIRTAQTEFGDRATFLCRDLASADLSEFPPFDLAISVGVLHHLSDVQAQAMLQLARRSIRPGGRLVTMDPCYVPGQHPVAKFLLDHDRGEYIRNAEGYRKLLQSVGKPEISVLSDMLRIPYSTIVVTTQLD
ncbi:MAG TPA: class I SAM-dependent methyltransferase [Bryobacteraceae bacterium]|nr:class I SAM-dependent methyltransferase [Bryobacteraceae bacterium]